MMVCTKSLCLSFLVVLLCFLALPRLADEEPINSRSGRDSSYNEDSHVVLTNPLQAAGVVSPSLGSKSQAVVEEKSENGLKDEEQREQHPLPVLTQHPILMQPSLADFKEVAVGMPQIKAITINNPSPSQTLQLTSVSGDTPDFHPSFFQSKVVRPGESTTFDIVFLPRRVGRVGTVLYIHTSLGTFKYEVYGTGIPNPYRLRAFLGIKIPANATYSPIVHMYNPHSTPLQITEIYSSGGDLHLELLTGQPEGTKSLWEIRPYETKPIIKLSFYGRSINNHTAFIRIKTNSSMEDSPIALPVEVKVTQAAGIFLSREFIDFGLLKSGDDMKPIPLYLLNAGPGSVHVSSISTVPPNDAIQIQYTPTTLRQATKYVKIASILYHIDKVKDHSQHHGKIVVVFEDPSMDILEIPYEATVMQGTITYEKTQTLFKVGKPPFKPVIRNMSLANQFQSPITLYDVRLPSRVQDHFTINLTKTPFILYPNSGWQKPFSVKFTPMSSDCQFSTSLRLHTNSSFFTIPLHCYDGKLKYEVQDIDKDSLEYGLMRYTDTISKRFLVININPVKVSITDYRVKSVNHASVELVHVRPSEDLRSSSSSPEAGGNYTEYKPLRTPFTIDVGHEAVFEVNVTKPNVKGKQEGEVLIRTSLGKELRVPIFYKVVLGTLQVEPEVIILKDGHPFTEVSANFSAWSFFDQPVKVVSVKPDPPDPKFYYLPPESGMPLLESEKMTKMGNVVYNPGKGEQSAQKPYLGLEEDDGRSSVANWLNSLNGISNQRVADNDARDYKLMRALWNKAKAKKVKGMLVLETDVSSNYEISIEASLHWPSLLPSTTISFPTTLVGNTSVEHVTVQNPSNRPLLVQALTLPVYPSPDSILRLLKTQFNFNTTAFDTSDLTTFYLPDCEAFENAVPTDLSREHHRDVGTVAHSPLTVTSMIPPYSSAVVRVAFSPKVENNFTSLLLLRNNLTILDALTLRGYGAAVKLLFGGKEPGTSSALLFEYTEASLILCHKELAAANSLRLVKTFTMRNTGQLPVHVLSMDFTGYGCSNYGFVVENCSNDFVLEPNATKDVRVSFTPDFTMSRIQQTLVLHMTQGTELAFLLLATLPHGFLPICYAALPRLDIEKLLSTITAIFMVLLLVVVIALALYSARYSNICKYYEVDIVHHSGPVFDLNNLTEDSYANRSGVLTGTQAETIHPGKTNYSREGSNNVTHCSQALSAVTNCQETSYSASTKLKTPLEDHTASCSQKTLENIINSSQNSTENSNTQLERRRRDNSQSMEETDHHNLKSPELSNSGMQSTTRASKPVAAVAGTSRNNPGKSTSKTESCNDPSPLTTSVSTTDFASQTPPLNASGPQAGLSATESTGVVDAPSYPKRKLSRKQSHKAFRLQNVESNTAKKSDSDKKTEAKSTHEKIRYEKEVVVEKEDTHEQVVVVVKEKPRDKVKPFTKDAGTGQAIPVEDAPHEGGVDAEDDLDDVGKKDLFAKGKDKKKKSRVPPKKEEKEKRKKDRELEMAEFSKIKHSSSESIEVESTTSTENLDDENPNGDEKVVKPDNPINDVKEEAKNSRPNDSPTGQSAPLEEETSKEQPAPEPQANDNQSKRNDKKALQLTEILSDPFSRRPDKTSYNSKKVMNASKKPSTERTKSASSEEPDDGKPPTPVGGAKIKQKSKQSDVDASSRAATDEQETTKSPESKVGDGVRLTTPHEIAASLLNKNTAIATRSKMKVEREAKEPPSKGEVVHPAAQSPPLGKNNEMLHMEGYPYMHANMPHHPHSRYLDMRADFSRSDAGALSLHAEPFVPTVFPKDHIYEDPRQMNRMEVSRLQTGKTLGDYMPPSVTQSSRHHYAKKHQENMFGDSKPMFEDPRALRHASMMMHPMQQKVSPTAAEESPVYSGSYHSEHAGLDHHFNYHYPNQDHRPEAYFEEDYSGLQSFDQQLVSRNARPNNLQYNLPEDGVSFHSSGMPGSHNIISASGRKGMSMMQGGGLTLTSPTSMFESPKKQQPSSLPSYQRPCPSYPMSSSDEGFHPRLSRQHYVQQLQQMKASKQLQRLPPPGLGEPQIGEKFLERGGIPWGTGDELCSDSMNIQMQQQHHLQEQQRRHYLMQQQHQRQNFDIDDFNEMLPSSHTSAASPVFSPHSLNLAPGSGFSSSVYEPKLSAMDLGWDNSKNHDNFQSDVHWGSNSTSDNNNSAVSMLWGGHSSYSGTSSRSLSTSHEEETNSSEPPKFSGNIYGLFDGSGSIWDPAASSTNSSLLPWATQSPQEHKDNTPN